MLLLLSRLLRALPLRWAMALAQGLGYVWYYLLPIRRSVARRNVERVFGSRLSAPQKAKLVRRACINLCAYAIEGLRMPGMTPASSAHTVARRDMHHVDNLLTRGKGIIAVTAHLGNFDLLGTSQSVRGYPVHAIVKDIKWPPAQAFWQSLRQATKLGRVAPRRSRQTIIELLRRNQIVAFLIDQHLPPHRAIVCRFFDALAATTPAPVRLAFETGAPILPIFIVRSAVWGHHEVQAHPEFILETPHPELQDNIRHNTERLNRLLEEMILAYPDQWLWHHRRWKVQEAPQSWHIPEDLQPLLKDPTAQASA
jgi:KDO2-lipid IV(A) lauroyltransferase